MAGQYTPWAITLIVALGILALIELVFPGARNLFLNMTAPAL